MRDQVEITGLLHEVRKGDRNAENELINAVYDDLRKIAHRYMAGERKGHTLQPTAIVHEAFLRIFRGGPVDWHDRAHFFAVAAKQMRRVLIDYGRAHRGGKVELDETMVANPTEPCDIGVIDDLLHRLQKTDAVAATVIELKFFAGLTDKEVAEVLSISHSSVRRHWMFARAWIGNRLEGRAGEQDQDKDAKARRGCTAET
jgi:RNA polymerase sigma factor (TIGR02999 family)